MPTSQGCPPERHPFPLAGTTQLGGISKLAKHFQKNYENIGHVGIIVMSLFPD